jgi:hypothetical protein
MPVDQDHSNIVKFGADDQDCQAVLSFILNAQVTNNTPSKYAESEDPDSTIDDRFGPDTWAEYTRRFAYAKS